MHCSNLFILKTNFKFKNVRGLFFITYNASGIKEVGFFFQPISFNPLLSVWFHFLFVRWEKIIKKIYH